MRDRQPSPGKEGRVLITPEDEGAPFYAVISMADDPIDEGTPLDKKNLLTDDTASILGLVGDPSVDDALKQIPELLKKIDASWVINGILPVVRGGTGVGSLAELAVALRMPNIKVGYYTGTGGYGASSPCSVSADFEVKLLILVAIQEEAYMYRPESLLTSSRPIMLTDGVPATEFRSYAGPFYDGSSEYTNGKVSADKKTLYWYNETSAYRQFNQANTRYHYLLFG